MDRDEFKFVLFCFVAILAIVGIPYIVGYVTEPEELTFGGMVLGVNTWATTSDWINQAKVGSLLFITNRTHEEEPALFLNTLFLLVGIFSGYTGLSNIGAYYIFLLVFGFLFLFILYRFLEMYFDDVKMRKSAFVIILTSSGFGFVFWIIFKALKSTPTFFSDKVPLGSRIAPADMMFTDTNVFLTLYSSNLHHVAAIAFMLLIYMLFLKGWEKEDPKYVLGSAVLTLILGTFHLYDIVTIYSIITVFVGITLFQGNPRWKLMMYATFIVVSIPPMLFNFYTFVLHPTFKEFTEYNVQLSPNPFSYIIGYGLLFFLASYYTLKKRIHESLKSLNYRVLLIYIWAIVNLVLLYAPITIQRKFLLGLSIPISIFATFAIFEFVLPRFKEHRRNLVLISIILLMVPSNFLWIAKETYKVNTHGYPGTKYPYYTHNLDLEAIQWLGTNAEKGDIILSGGATGGRIAGMVSKRVYWGGNDMTIRYQEKMRLVEEFFSTMNDAERRDILAQNSIRFVYYGEEERSLGDFDPESANYLKKVFENSRVKIYEVKD